MGDESPLLSYEEDDDALIPAASLILKLRGLGISDRHVLNAIETVPRTLFVPKPWRAQAYADRSLPIDCGQSISAPSMVGLMTAALDVSDRHSVLEIGTGSGYGAAVLSRLARRVTTIERFRTLVRSAERRWLALGIRNISAVVADGALGWSRQAPFDRILVTAAAKEPPQALIDQLQAGGRMVIPIGSEGEVQQLSAVEKSSDGAVEVREVMPVRFTQLETMA